MVLLGIFSTPSLGISRPPANGPTDKKCKVKNEKKTVNAYFLRLRWLLFFF